MKYGILGDIHGNLEAFLSVLKECASEEIDRFFCVGDVVGYGARPNECIEKIRSIGARVVAGNHDWAAVNKADASHLNPAAHEAILWTYATLSGHSAVFLNSLPLTLTYENFTVVHGTLNNPEEFMYLTDPLEAQETFALLKTALCFIGHSHIPFIFLKEGEYISSARESSVAISPDKNYIVNVGSIGQPRDRDSRACYCVYDSGAQTIAIKRAAYNIEQVQKEILAAGLPSFLAHRLSRGV